jgi:hypothetical protein
MICDTCGNTKAYKMEQRGNEPPFCDRCGYPGEVFLPDVYFKSGEVCENLVDDKGNGVAFGTRMEKYKFMKERGVREAGDMCHGQRGFMPGQMRESKAQTRVIVHDAVERAKAQLKGYGRAYG